MMLEQNDFIYDVIIAGAGPVGLFLACELALANCSVLVLEKAYGVQSPLKQFPFGIRGLSALTIEALYRRGLLRELELHKQVKNPHQNSGQGARRQLGHFAGIPFYEGDVDTSQWAYRLPGSTPTSLISEMQELEMVFSRQAQNLGATIKHGLAVTALQQNNEGVTVQCAEQSFKGKWLVGCDGSRSIVRKAGGFEFAGTEPEFTGYTILVDIADTEKLNPGRNITPTGMYMQSQPGYITMQHFDAGAFHNSGKPITLQHLQDVLRYVSNNDVTITSLYTATTWTDRARQATTYRNGRILLAGDAAHIHSPLGGQGLNLGLGDAMNLGWKLAATIHYKASESLLDSYYAERYPIGAQVLDWSRAQVAIMKPELGACALNAIIRDLMATRDGATYIAGRVWGVHTHYDLAGEHPIIGHSTPDFELDDGTKIGDLMRNGQGILLDFDSNNSLKTLVNEYSERIKYVASRATEQLGLSAVLVRPDGFIAWACEGEPDMDSARLALKSWFNISLSTGQVF